MPGATYDLKLTANLESKAGQFDASTQRSRKWAKRDANSLNWNDLPIDPNIRGVGPVLNFNTSDVLNADTVQMTVYFYGGGIGSDWSHLSSLTIYAVFTPADHSQLPVASPFRDSSENVKTILSGSWSSANSNGGIVPHPDVAPGVHAAVFPLGSFSIDPVVASHSNNKKWKFEFTLVAHFEFTSPSGNQIREYAYDPEMEVDVGTGTDPGEKNLYGTATA